MKQRTRGSVNNSDEVNAINMASLRKIDNVENDIQQIRIMRPQEHYLEAQIQEGDTLQAIALRFHCPISELKRINQIHKEFEIFARRTIKVPVTPYSVLTEMLPENPQPVPSKSTNVALTIHNTEELPNNNAKKDSDFAIECHNVVLNSQFTPAVVPYTDSDPNEPITEDTQLLPNKDKVSVEAVVVKQLTSQGADFGLKWYHLTCVLLILGFLTPLVYVIFILHKYQTAETHPVQSH